MTDLATDVATHLVLLGRLYRREIDAALHAYGLSDATALPIVHIGRMGEGVRQRQLAEALGVEGPSLVRVLDLLAGAGLIERHEDPTDRRAKTLHLTPAGREQRTLIESVLHEVRARLFHGVDPADMTAAVRVFEHLGTAIAEGRAA